MSDTLAFRPSVPPTDAGTAPGDAASGGPFSDARGGLAAPVAEPAAARRGLLLVAAVLLVAYVLLLNRYWVPGGDSDFYVAIARSLARGQGFRYNGLPVAICPPGWPWVMAMVMKIAPTFLALKLVAMTSMFGSLLVGYRISLRFLSPSAAALAVILAGLLMPVYSLTYFLHSEGVYCLLSAVALLLALRLRERRGGVAATVGLLMLCVAIPLTRWAGLLQLVPTVAVLMSGRPGTPLLRRHWKTALACFLVIVGTWFGTREVLKLTPEDIAAAKADYGTLTDSTEISEDDIIPKDAKGPPLIAVGESGKHGFVQEYSLRVLRAGKWFSWLLWQPSRFVSVSKGADVLVDLVGWGVIGVLAFLAVVEARRGDYLWLSLGLYSGGLCLGWDNPNSRYFVPVAALITTALLLAIKRAAEFWPATKFDGWKWLRRGVVYSILLTNLAMFGVDVIVMRSTRFYATFEAGQHKDLISIASYLSSLPPEPHGTTVPASLEFRPGDGDTMVNERYENLGRVRYSKASSRAMTLLLDRFVKPLDYGQLSKQLKPVNASRLSNEMRRRGCEWLLIQAPAVPWRLWHFRLPPLLQDKLEKDKDAPNSGGWTLYHFTRTDRTFLEQPVPAVEDWPTRVPGM